MESNADTLYLSAAKEGTPLAYEPLCRAAELAQGIAGYRLTPSAKVLAGCLRVLTRAMPCKMQWRKAARRVGTGLSRAVAAGSDVGNRSPRVA